MAGRLVFHYLPGESLLHRWDARCKFAAVALSGFALLQMDGPSLAVFSLLPVCAVVLARLPWKNLLREVRVWWLFLAAVFLMHSWSPESTRFQAVPWLPTGAVPLQAAALACFRLGLVLCLAAVFTAVTRPRELEDAVLWLLQPFPFLPARRIALMATLTMRFLPVLLDEADEVRTAGRARLGSRRRNPILRMKFFVLPLFRRSLLRADELALALAARGYREDLPLVLSAIPAIHLAALALFGALVLLLVCGPAVSAACISFFG